MASIARSKKLYRLVASMERIIHSSRESDAMREAGRVLESGGVVAIPTDTVYGLATLLPSVEKLYAIKGRDAKKPVAICVKDIPEIHKWARVEVSDELLHELLPGPVTLVFPRSAHLPSSFNPGTSLVGVRIPPHPVVAALSSLVTQPLALTSANVSSQGSTLSVQEFSSIWKEIDLIIDGGDLEDGERRREGSTVVDLSVSGTFSILRNGSALRETKAMLTGEKYKLKSRPQNGRV